MTGAQRKEADRDWTLVALDRAVLDLVVDLKSPAKDELYSVEGLRDRLSRYLDKHKAKDAA